MFGINQNILDYIEKTIGTQFDELLVDFLGVIPKMNNKKKIIFTSKKDSLTSLFIHALGTNEPNKSEEEVLKTQLRIAAGYVEALKTRTQTRAVQAVNAHAQEQSFKNENIKPSVVRKLVMKELDGSQNHVRLIANSESNKCVNTGTALQIAKVAESNEDTDPTVFFVVTIDDKTGSEEFRLHLLPDKKTPKLWKLKDIGAEYHKKGDWNPKLPGLHPNCRCRLTYLPKGFGFDKNGKITWIKLDHDEIIEQRKIYGNPEEKML